MMRNCISRIAFLAISLFTVSSCAQTENAKNHTTFTRYVADGDYYFAAKFAVENKLFTGAELKVQVKDLCKRASDSEMRKLQSDKQDQESRSLAEYAWFWQDLTDISMRVGNTEESCGYARAGFDTAVKRQENLAADHFYHQNRRCMPLSSIPSDIVKQHDDIVYGQWHYYVLGDDDTKDAEFLKAHPYNRAYVQAMCDNELALLDFNSARRIAKNGKLGASALFRVERAESLHFLSEALSKRMYQTAHYLIRDRARFLIASDVSDAVHIEYETALKAENARHAYALARSFAFAAALVRRAEKQMIAESIRRGDFSIGKMLPDGTFMVIKTMPNSREESEEYLSYERRRGW